MSSPDFGPYYIPPLTEEEELIKEEVEKWRNSDRIKQYDAEDYEEHVFSDEEEEEDDNDE